MDFSKGIINTKMNENESRYITLDWLTISFRLNCDILEFIAEHLHMDYDDFIFQEGGIGRSYHYARTAKFEQIQVYYSTPADVENGANEGITVNFNGQACRQYEIYRWSNNEHWSWYNTIQELHALSGKCTRLDIAHDFINSKFTWQFILNKIYKKTLIFAGNVQRRNKINTKTGEDFHASIYFGDKPQQLNIYDKKGERFDKSGEEYDVDSWTRWELRLFGDKSEIAFIELSNGRGLADLFCGILGAHYKFVTLTGDKNRSRRNLAYWWLELLNQAKQTKLLVEKDKPTMKRKENWLVNHGPDKAELMLYIRDLFVYGNDAALSNLMKRVQHQRTKLTDNDIQMILQAVLEELRATGSVNTDLKPNEINSEIIIGELHKFLYSDI